MDEIAQTYRRAYRDGWIEALNAICEMAIEGDMSLEDAHEACWNHCQEGLSDWQDRAQDDANNRLEIPPRVP